MIAIGIDIGGTKIEAQSFASDWSLVDQRRISTPGNYNEFIAAISDQVKWAIGDSSSTLPIGISSAGYSNPVTGEFVAANLPASRKPFLADLAQSLGQAVTLINDARAFTQSEAVFGVAKSERVVAGVILGTGVGGGIVIDKHIHEGAHAIAGEFGHTSAPANVVTKWGLPLTECRCGRIGCIETLASGPGLKRICTAMTGRSLEPAKIAAERTSSAEVARVWRAWCALVSEHLLGISLCVEPDVVVLGGGLSKIPGLTKDISDALTLAHLISGASPAIRLAEGGDASGARGAAYAAWQKTEWAA